MGVSFKISRTGTRFRPKPSALLQSDAEAGDVSVNSEEAPFVASKSDSATRNSEGKIINQGNKYVGVISGSSVSTEGNGVSPDDEVSIALHLFPDGYYIGKSLENELSHDLAKLLRPYNRISENLFSAIECGHFPSDMLAGLPCKYVDGSVICEVRDHRRSASEQGTSTPTVGIPPAAMRVKLKITLENVVKDIPLISDSSWTYGDLMEVESRILKALQPKLCLDPSPKLDRLSDCPVPEKLKAALSSAKRKRLRQLPEISVTSNRIHGKKVAIDRAPEICDSRLGDVILGNGMQQHAIENTSAQNAALSNSVTASPRNGVTEASFQGLAIPSHQQRYPVMHGNRVSPSGQEMMISYSDNNSSGSAHGKRENQDGPMSPLSNVNKRARVSPMVSDGVQQQQMDNLHVSDWKNSLYQQQQVIARGIQYSNSILKTEPGVAPVQSGMRYGAMEGQMDGMEAIQNRTDLPIMDTEKDHVDPQQAQLQHRLTQHALMKSGFPQWNNVNPQHIDMKKEQPQQQLQKRKSAQSPRVSVQSPLSSKSGDFSSGSLGPQFGAGPASAITGLPLKDKVMVTSVPPGSMTSSANDSMQRQNLVPSGKAARSNSFSKAPTMSGVGSPVSVSTHGIPLNASSPSMGTPLADQTVLERFSKIDAVTMRHNLNRKKHKVDECPVRKSSGFSTDNLMRCLSNLSNNEDFIDKSSPMLLSRSIIGGTTNTCKSRVLNFVQADRVYQGNAVSYVSKARCKMSLFEKGSNGTVAMIYGDLEDVDVLDAEDFLPTLPNRNIADLLADQFRTLLVKEGYTITGDDILAKPIRQSHPLGSPSGMSQSNSSGQFVEGASSQQQNEQSNAANSSHAPLNSAQIAANRMMPPGNTQQQQPHQMSQGAPMAARTQQLDAQTLLQQQKQQQQQQQHGQNPMSQYPRSSPMMLAANHMSQMNSMAQNSNMQLGDHMANKASPLHLHMLQQQQQQNQNQQQQQQQQQNQHMQRKMMMSMGMAPNMGIGNMGNSLVGLGNPAMGGMGAARGMGSIGQNPINLGQPSGLGNSITQRLQLGGSGLNQQAALVAQKLKLMNSRAGLLGGPQSGMSNVPGARPMHPGSAGLPMLGPGMNRGNMNPMQRQQQIGGLMGPPKMMSGMNNNVYANPQQQMLPQQLQMQQQQMQMQQLQQQQQQQQQQKLQQQENSSLQSVGSQPQIGSPSSMGMPQMNPQQQQQQQQQQQSSPQQMSQRTPMSPQQISSSQVHAMSAGNPDPCPASPQLSSQTLGSVGSIGNSPMDVQGVNKSNSMSNT